MRIVTSQSGAAAVEFALVITLLLILVIGIIEFGLILYNQQVITNASREGARAGIVARSPRVTPAAIEQVVLNYTSNHLITFGTQNTPVVTITNPTTSFGDDLTVNVTFKYNFLLIQEFVKSLIDPFTLTSQTVMKYE